MSKDRKPLILVLSGTYGVGKTTLAHQLGIDLQIMTRVSLGGITNTITTVIPDDPKVKNWNKYNSLNKEYIRKKLRTESKIVGKIIHNIVRGAEYAKENYIFEGMQLIPEFLPMDKILFFHVYVSDSKKHNIQFSKPVITRSLHKNKPSYQLTKKLGKILLEECADQKIFKINNVGSPARISRQMIEMIKKVHPNFCDEYLWYEKIRN